MKKQWKENTNNIEKNKIGRLILLGFNIHYKASVVFLHFHIVHGVLQARSLEWVAISFSSGPHFVWTLHYVPSSCLALHVMAHSFMKLHKPLCHDKTVMHGREQWKEKEFWHKMHLNSIKLEWKPVSNDCKLWFHLFNFLERQNYRDGEKISEDHMLGTGEYLNTKWEL